MVACMTRVPGASCLSNLLCNLHVSLPLCAELCTTVRLGLSGRRCATYMPVLARCRTHWGSCHCSCGLQLVCYATLPAMPLGRLPCGWTSPCWPKQPHASLLARAPCVGCTQSQQARRATKLPAAAGRVLHRAHTFHLLRVVCSHYAHLCLSATLLLCHGDTPNLCFMFAVCPAISAGG